MSLGPVGGRGGGVCVVGAIKEVVAKEANTAKVVDGEGKKLEVLGVRVEIMPIVLVGHCRFLESLPLLSNCASDERDPH